MTAVNGTHDVRGAVSPEAIADFRAYRERCDEMGSTMGVINAAHGHLVEIAATCLAEGDHIGPGLHSPGQFLAWRLGVSTEVANQLCAVARRRADLREVVGALQAGEISLEQAAVVARHLPSEFDASGTRLAKVATVSQLQTAMKMFRKPRKEQRRGPSVSIRRHEEGGARLIADLTDDQADVVEQALRSITEDLWRQRQADEKAAAEESGEQPASVPVPDQADALAAMAETSLRAGEAAHPGSDRYVISYHLQQGADGRLLLVDDRGLAVEDGERRRILCDHRFESVLHDHDGVPLSVGRQTRCINRKLRRAILHRHRGCCAVPGCHSTRGLEIHHIWHWEDGGPTDTWNLIAFCRFHHRMHHQGQLHVAGNADLEPGTPGALVIGPEREPLDDAARPSPVVPTAGSLDDLREALRDRTGLTPPRRASTPTGEPLYRPHAHLEPAPPPPPDLEPESEADVEPPVAAIHRRGHHPPPSGRRSPAGPPDAHGPPAA